MNDDFQSGNFHFFPAYSIETLAKELAREISRRTDPFVPETVLITNYAQRIWLQHYLARENGICANIRFVSPESFLNKLCESGNAASYGKAFNRDALAWRIFKTLRSLHAPGSNTPPQLRFSFRENREEDFILTAQTLADLFWRYQSFRTEMIVAWTRGDDIPELHAASPDFKFEYARQKHLWSKLALREDEIPALRYRSFYEDNFDLNAKNLPKRLFVFAPTALPKTHFEMLKKLSKHSQVLFYYHNLSDNYWIESRNRKNSLAAPQNLERGNELLTSWGKAARALAGGLIEDNLLGGVTNGDDAPERDSLLHQLQADIRENVTRREESTPPDDLFAAPPPSPAVTEDSVSLRIHAAHSRMREMEILRDDLRDLTARDASVRPRDILVMLPDINAYAPFIRAVFEESEFPFSLADSTGTERFRGISAFLSLMKISQGEIRISEVLELFNSQALARRLSLSEEDVKSLRKILIDSNARWGADATSREKKIFGSAETSPENTGLRSRVAYNNSWDFALRRCALGVMTGNSATPAGTPLLAFGENREILPSQALPENAAELLGKFFRVFDLIKTLVAHYSGEKKTITEWCRFLKNDLADSLLSFSEEEIEEENLLAEAIESVRNSAETAAMESEDVELKTVVSMLENRSWESKHGSGMLRGKITFCRLQPLRNIPAKAIYIAGMNPGEFPRPNGKSTLDLISQWPKTLEWDRSSRDEDCLLLLEAVLAAKTYLRFSYIGRNAKDNSVIPPCTPLSKLIDELIETALPPNVPAEKREDARAAALNRFFFEHPPQSRLPEKTPEKVQTIIRWRPPLFTGTPIKLSARERESFSALSTEQICSFFAEPARFICRNRLNLKSSHRNDIPNDSDPGNGKISSKEMLEELLASGVEALTTPGVEAQNIIVENLRNSLEKTIRRNRASGAFSPVATSEEFAQTLKIKSFKQNRSTWQKLIGEEFLRRIGPETHTVEIPFEGTSCPSVIRVRVEYERFQNPDGKACLIKTFPQLYSTEWEFKICSAVTAAFIRAALPKENFTFIALHRDVVSRKAASVLTLESDSLPPELAENLLRRFFDGLENPPLLFAQMPLPSSNDPEAFRKTFEAQEKNSSDFDRFYRELLFGTDRVHCRREHLCGDVFEFSRQIAKLFPQH